MQITIVKGIIGTLLLSFALLLGVYGFYQASYANGYGDNDEKSGFLGTKTAWKTAPERELYTAECGACHMAYPPRLLPPVSWQTMMNGLEDHFGENAELTTADANTILHYLVTHAGSSWIGLSTKDSGVPLRITSLPYFIQEHDDIPKRLLKHKDVGSFSNCQACHKKAAEGNFDDDDISILGYGRYHD